MAKFADAESASIAIEQAWDEIGRIKPVFDAAMALVRYEREVSEGREVDPEWDKYFDALHDACRKAEEVERGDR